MYSREYQGSLLLLAGHRWWCDNFCLSASSWDNTPLFCFYFTIINRLCNASSPEHISVLFTVSNRRPSQSFGAELWFEFNRMPHWLEEWFINCCFVARLSASRYLCGSTCWNGVTRTSAESSIILIGTIHTSLSWCTLQTQVGHSSLGATPDASVGE